MADATIDLERLRSLAEGEKCFGQSYCAECLHTIAAAADKIEAQERILDKLRELHRPLGEDDGCASCCLVPNPPYYHDHGPGKPICPTRAILDGEKAS